MNGKFIRSSRPFFPKDDIDKISMDIATVLEEGRLRNGKNLCKFENMVAEYLDVENAIGFDSDSSALETALMYFDVKDREVVVCTNSFISVPNSVLYAGGKVVFADICEDTLSMDPKSLSESISADTCGVVVTHIAGFPNPNLIEIMEICEKYNLFLIEDATHAIGATINNQKVGTFGDAAIFAFTPTKVITTGEGGMLVTEVSELTEYARRFSYYGSGPGKTNFVNLGRHMMMPEVSAVLGLYQLKRIDEFIKKRNEIANIYNEAFDKTYAAKAVKCRFHEKSSYYKYPLILSDKVDKARFTQELEKVGVETGNVFYPPSHLQPVYQKLCKSKCLSLPVSEKVLAQTVTLPMHVGLSEADVTHVIESSQSALRGA